MKTQRDALAAIRGICQLEIHPTTRAIRDIAEQGLSLPPVELTPAQQHADKLAEYASDMLEQICVSPPPARSVVYADELQYLLAQLEPAPPTMQEALAILVKLDHHFKLQPDHAISEHGSIVTEARQLLARVPK